jgi:hypothetical protein
MTEDRAGRPGGRMAVSFGMNFPDEFSCAAGVSDVGEWNVQSLIATLPSRRSRGDD